MSKRIVTLLLPACIVVAPACSGATPRAPAPAPVLALTVEKINGADGGAAYQIASSGNVAAAPATVWRILTDYDHMAEFVPDLHSARVVSRTGNTVIVEQLGAARLLFLRRAIRLVVQVHEQAPDKIDVSLVDGDMKVYRCSWELVPVPGANGTRVLYSATIAPKFYVPGIVGASLVRKDIARMMAAVLARLDRDEH